MTPNKLPPLPETWYVMKDEETPAYSDDQMHAYAAEAIAEDEAVIKKLSTALAEIAVTIGAHLPDGQVVDYRELPSLVAEALRQSQSLPAGAVADSLAAWLVDNGMVIGNDATANDYLAKAVELLSFISPRITNPSRPEIKRLIEAAKSYGAHSELRSSSDETIAYWKTRVDELEQALQADAREKGEAVNYPAAFKFAMQQAVENIKVPKMSPLKQELFKAGTVATINAINAALATQPAQASENVPSQREALSEAVVLAAKVDAIADDFSDELPLGRIDDLMAAAEMLRTFAAIGAKESELWRKNYAIEIESDPPFPYGVAVVTDTDGGQSCNIHGDDPVLWHFLAAIASSGQEKK